MLADLSLLLLELLQQESRRDLDWRDGHATLRGFGGDRNKFRGCSLLSSREELPPSGTGGGGAIGPGQEGGERGLYWRKEGLGKRGRNGGAVATQMYRMEIVRPKVSNN